MYEREIEELQRKLLTTMAERDTIRSAFQALIGVLKLPEDTDPLSFSLTSINVGTQANTSERVQLSKDAYPGLRFRVRSDYDSFATSPEAQSMDRGKAPWLEQANGDPITADQLRAIRASLRRAWAELVQCKLAPQTWTKISASAKSLVYQIMIKEHPLLGLDEDGFKLEMLCVNDYSGWRKNHLTPNGEWKEPSHKTEPKEEPKLEYTDIVSPLAMKGKKHKSDPKLVRERTKRHKEKRQEIHSMWNCQSRPDQEVISPQYGLRELPDVRRCAPPSESAQKSRECPMWSGATNACWSIAFGIPYTSQSAALAGLSSLSRHNSNKENTSHHRVAKAPQLSMLSRHNSNKENEFSLQDPLWVLFVCERLRMNGIAKKPPPPTYPSMPAASQEPPEPSTAKTKKSKMCPGAAKNARNLCAHRWLKQVNTNGTTEEFRIYWDSLTSEQREDYHLEAERLEGEGKCAKPSDAVMCNGTLH
ncbi:hypothetical protein EDC04DRAFT_3147363 [Pisolithus marmoratus]|nr:hypothetical protein EDC04DRAFT_3147363 [Pisolithus marmoratus]